MPVDNKFYTRTVKLIATAVIAFAVMLVTARLKYGGAEGWGSTVAHLWEDPRRPLLFLIFFPIFFYDVLSIIAFKFGFERTSDEFEWHGVYYNSGIKMPRVLKLFSYPLAMLFVVLFI